MDESESKVSASKLNIRSELAIKIQGSEVKGKEQVFLVAVSPIVVEFKAMKIEFLSGIGR